MLYALGKLLYMAQDYEANCRALMTLIEVKRYTRCKAIDFDSSEFHDKVNTLWTRSLGHNINFFEQLGIPEDASTLLRRAKNARNTLAHELALGLDHKLQHDELLGVLFLDVRQCASDIAEANRFIFCLIQIVTNESIPPALLDRQYIATITDWVLKQNTNDILSHDAHVDKNGTP